MSGTQNKRGWAVALVVVGLVASACGSDPATPTQQEAAVETTQAAPTTEAPGPTSVSTSAPTTAPTTAAPSTTSPTTTTDATGKSASTLPTSGDPCATAAAHELGAEGVEYTFDLAGEAIPMGVYVEGESALAEGGVLWVALHPPAESWPWAKGFTDRDKGLTGLPEGSHAFVYPNAQSADPFWSRSASYNVEHLETLFAALDSSFCLDRMRVILSGVGQGALAAGQAVCQGEVPVDLLFQAFTMVAMNDCQPPNPVPVIGVLQYDFNAVVGGHWDGAWTPPVDIEIDLVGEVPSGPAAVAGWAAVNGCTDDPAEQTFEGLGADRPPIELAHEECDAFVVGYGLPTETSGVGFDGSVYEAMANVLAPWVQRAIAE